jgi:hypothetical protein
MFLSDAIKDLAQKVDNAVLIPGPQPPDEKAPRRERDEFKARTDADRDILKNTLAELKERMEAEHKADEDGIKEIEGKIGDIGKATKAQAQAQAQAATHARK